MSISFALPVSTTGNLALDSALIDLRSQPSCSFHLVDDNGSTIFHSRMKRVTDVVERDCLF